MMDVGIQEAAAHFRSFGDAKELAQGQPPGIKLDDGKIQADLLLDFRDALMAVAKISTFGAKKYTRHGWVKVPDGVNRYRAAFMRHVLQDGVDAESCMPHSWHALWNLLAMVQLEIDQGKT